MSTTSEARENYRHQHPTKECALCGRPGCDVHEICRGVHRKKAIEHPEAMLLLCRSCHKTMDFWSPAMQYALKGLCEPSLYDRVLLNSIRGRQPDAISEQEVMLEMEGVVRRCLLSGKY